MVTTVIIAAKEQGVQPAAGPGREDRCRRDSVSLKRAAELSGRSRNTIRRMLSGAELPGRLLETGEWRIEVEDLLVVAKVGTPGYANIERILVDTLRPNGQQDGIDARPLAAETGVSTASDVPAISGLDAERFFEFAERAAHAEATAASVERSVSELERRNQQLVSDLELVRVERTRAEADLVGAAARVDELRTQVDRNSSELETLRSDLAAAERDVADQTVSLRRERERSGERALEPVALGNELEAAKAAMGRWSRRKFRRLVDTDGR